MTSINNEKSVTGLDAAIDSLAVPYQHVAKSIANKLAEINNIRTNGLWNAVRKSVGVAADAGHDVEQYKQGMAAALEQAEAPAGSIRSYMDTACKLLELIATGKADVDTVLKMSIAEARKLVPSKRKPRAPEARKEAPALDAPAEFAEVIADAKAGNAKRRQALSALMRAIVRLSTDQILELVELAEAQLEAPAEDEAVQKAA